jgi:hypothetical protein
VNSVPDHPPTFYLAIDPGLTTGWASLTLPDAFAFGEIRGRFELYQSLRLWSSTGAVPEVVIEEFTVRKDTHKMSPQPDPWRIIGYVEGLCDQNGWRFSTQTPGQAKGFGDDRKLKALGWEATTKGGHARDAARHLLTYLTRKYGKPGEVGHDLLVKIMESTDE